MQDLERRATPAGVDVVDATLCRGARAADQSYALAFRAVSDLASLDPDRGLTLFFQYWKETGRFDDAVRRAYGMTADTFAGGLRPATRSGAAGPNGAPGATTPGAPPPPTRPPTTRPRVTPPRAPGGAR